MDFAWPDVDVALEVDGPHHFRPEGAVRDRVRDAELRRGGWIVLRVDYAGSRDDLRAQLARVAQIVRMLRDRNGHWPDAARLVRIIRDRNGRQPDAVS